MGSTGSAIRKAERRDQNWKASGFDLITSVLSSTGSEYKMSSGFKILEHFIFSEDSSVSALSGAACVGNDLYLVGDDVGYLLKTNQKNNINRATIFEIIPLFEQPKHTTLTVFSKKTKPDFEALSCIRFDGQPQLLVMGSGSTENRKKALLYNPADHQVHVLLDTSDYDFLEHCLALTGGADLNIEAVCSDQNNLYIFQRGNINRFHGVLVFDLIKLQNGKSLESALKNSFNLTLPELEGAASGISDAYFFVEKNLIIATAAVEQTLNTYDDGAVLGSFILVLSPEGKILFTHLIQDSKGQTLAIKVEGITWLESTSDGEVFLLVTDSDGGESEVFKILLSNSVFANSSS